MLLLLRNSHVLASNCCACICHLEDMITDLLGNMKAHWDSKARLTTLGAAMQQHCPPLVPNLPGLVPL
jgi:hypothetical protein